MVCFKDYTQETIVDFLANMRTNEPSTSVPVGQPYDIVPYDSDNISENSDEYQENNKISNKKQLFITYARSFNSGTLCDVHNDYNNDCICCKVKTI